MNANEMEKKQQKFLLNNFLIEIKYLMLKPDIKQWLGLVPIDLFNKPTP